MIAGGGMGTATIIERV
ncbi:hypothetical protein D522_17952 [Mycobacterium avium subsp. paratuberculosis S5]|nr:hypothetical protein D522_17952 [Mycobacterium avium subsp. paratuberculosis S5]